jgi:hypothetical protein
MNCESILDEILKLVLDMVQATKSHVQPLVTRTKFELDHATNGLLNGEFE